MGLYTEAMSAIKAAILAADTACPSTNVHTRTRNPLNPTFTDIFAIYGKTDSDGVKTWRGWSVVRKRSGDEELTAQDGNDDIVSSTMEFTIRGFATFRDNVDTETEWQETIDRVLLSLRSDTEIDNLVVAYQFNRTSAALEDSGLMLMFDTELVHFAYITIRFRHEDELQTI